MKKLIDPCGHAAKIAKQNDNMPEPMKKVMNTELQSIQAEVEILTYYIQSIQTV